MSKESISVEYTTEAIKVDLYTQASRWKKLPDISEVDFDILYTEDNKFKGIKLSFEELL